jgi:HD-like signal output (HDOD) protein
MPLTEQVIKKSIESCPRLGSLRKINSTFKDLTNADQDYTGQIAEIIRRDPSLTSRLLQMVNSVFYALSDTVDSVEDAVFYLGTRQIRQMALVTPVLEDLQKFTDKAPSINWIKFWQQSIGCAIMTREVLSFSNLETRGDSDYISGLIFGVGYLVSIYAFPKEMAEIFRRNPQHEIEILELQKAMIGWDQTEIGGYYMESHNIPEDIRFPIQYQLHPELAGDYQQHASAIYVAKRMIAELSGSRQTDDESQPDEDTYKRTKSAASSLQIPLPSIPSWDTCPELLTLLDPDHSDTPSTLESLRYTLNQLPDMLRGLV